MNRSLLLSVLTTFAACPLPSLLAQGGDAQPPDAAQLLQSLKQLREINETGTKNRRTQAYQQVVAAVSSTEKAVAFWKEAVKNAQFEGAEKEGAQIRDWREGEGDALNDKLCQTAVQLHLRWLALTLQHSAGYETRQLLPQVLDFIKAVQAQDAAAEHFADQLNKAREKANEGRRPGGARGVGEDAVVKRMHDQIMRTSVGQGPVAKWLQLGDLLGDGGGGNGGNGGGPNGGPGNRGPAKPKVPTSGSSSASGWEGVPGNLDGIYNNIVLPEFRATKDQRLLEYWDMHLKRETERAAERKLDVEQREWLQVKRPTILWGRSQDVLLLGFKNRAINEMFTLVKTYPQHPEAQGWISQIESLLGAIPGTPPPAPTPAPAPGAVTPSAHTPPTPTATLAPQQPPAVAPGVRP